MSSPYNLAFACLDCCKSFKREFDLSKECPAELKCPDCGGISYNFGRHFKAPKKSNKKQWKKITYLFNHGFRFQKMRIGKRSGNFVSYTPESIPYPETLEQAKEFVAKYKDYAIK
jgi:hypothetical protein